MGIPLGVAYAPSTAAIETLNWLVPVGFGWYIASRDESLEAIEHMVATTMRWAALVLGGYGI